MSRLLIENGSVIDNGYTGLGQRIAQRVVAMHAEQCPVDFALSMVRLCSAQSCGKCTPCRVGLFQAAQLMEYILAGAGEEEDLERLRQVAQTMLDASDCAIGFEAGRMLLAALDSFAADFQAHVQHDRCDVKHFAYVPCQAECPAHVDIPGYLSLIAAGRNADALRVIRNDNPLPTVCGYVCEHPCELSCRRAMVDSPVNICGLKRFAADNAEAHTPQPNQPSTGKKVAIIGGGPAGLSAAYYLQLMGHACTIFDVRPKLGGMVRYGIPDYRLPQDKLDEDINFILATGVEARTGVAVDAEQFAALMKEYDAAYVSIGAHTHKSLGIEGENARGVLSAVEFLRAAGEGAPVDLTGKRVVIVGGGNVAMDCTRTAKRLGAASVECVYRRRIADMTALQEEIDEALAEGCQITQLQAPVRIEVDEQDQVTALITQPQLIGEVKRGRPAPVPADLPEQRIPADVVLVAIGQAIVTEPFEFLIPTARGKFVARDDGSVEPVSLMHEGCLVFAGGDAVSGPATVIKAVAAGKVAAANIDEGLGFAHNVFDEVELPEPAPTLPATGRVELTSRTFAEAAQDFDIAKLGMTAQAALQESNRCLHCDHHGFGAVCGRVMFKW
ncbi:MAG: NAD(P)-binding protein [Coriobacteriia bacterium]|nr:NAD(P)-binding protein [Coriobacteriia bacterium]